MTTQVRVTRHPLRRQAWHVAIALLWALLAAASFYGAVVYRSPSEAVMGLVLGVGACLRYRTAGNVVTPAEAAAEEPAR